MTKAGADFALLTPAAEGWRLHHGATPPQTAATLAEIAPLLPAGCPVHLALPCEALVIEGLKLPATERDELAGMVRLQLEKNLPYPLDEVSSDFLIVESSGLESTIIALAAPHAPLETLCQPLRDAGRLPEKITPFVLHIAAVCPAEETVLAVYPEQGQLVLAICADRKLCWAHVMTSTAAARLSSELPQVLLAATMEGAPTNFSRVLLAAEFRALGPVFQAALTVLVEPLPPIAPALAEPINLEPASWRSAAQRQRKAGQLRRHLQTLAMIYVLVAVAVGTYLALLHRQAGRLTVQFEAARPQLEAIQARQARANTLAPAVDPGRTTVELLYLLQKALPDRAVRITEFDQQLGQQWRITGEAPSAALAIDYVSRIKAAAELSSYEITAGPPQLLPNEHAQFSIFGKR